MKKELKNSQKAMKTSGKRAWLGFKLATGSTLFTVGSALYTFWKLLEAAFWFGYSKSIKRKEERLASNSRAFCFPHKNQLL